MPIDANELVPSIYALLTGTWPAGIASGAEASGNITPSNYAPLTPGVDVRRYGAKVDGTTNDTTAIQTALTYNDVVYIDGTSVASGLQMTRDGQILFGVGRDSGFIAANNTQPCLIASSNHQVISNLSLSTGSLATNDTNSYTVTAITKAASGVVTINAGGTVNPIATGQYVMFLTVGGMTQINAQQPALVTAIGGSSGAWTFTLNLNTSSFTTYTSGGTAVTTGFIGLQLAYVTRCLVSGVQTSGVWAHAIELDGAIYSTVQLCNLDGFRKRAITVNGGGDLWIINNQEIFDASLTAPTDAHIYINQAAAIRVKDNLITRSSSSAGPAIVAVNPAGGFLGQLLWITGNTIDNGQNWAVQTNGYWDQHIKDNWCAWGQHASNSYGQISVSNAQKFYINDNDVYGSLVQGIGIALNTCNAGRVSGNTVEYNYNGIVVTTCTNTVVSENTSGQITGLPPSGVPTQNSFVEVSCAVGCNITWKDNIPVSPVVAAYSGIVNTVVSGQGYTNSKFNVQTGNYTLILSDRNGTVEMNDGSASTLTIPTNAFSGGDEITVMASQATIAVTITFPGGALFFANGSFTTGNRTLTGAGYAKIKFQSANIAMISGTGLS